MSIVSYAQNFEDVMLWRALKHVANGHYIDIGAQDPVIDSVSMAFYEHGWRGVHVEPTTQYAEKLRAARPDETVMQIAIGSSHGSLTFFEFKDTGLSTADPAIAQQHKEHGFECLETRVPMMSLDALLDQSGARPVHWLKLDVEGLEKSVLESWQLSAVRPWILVIESTLPLTQEPNYAVWESLVFAKGYEFSYFDGLNRFYVSQEHIHLKSAFDRPPNIFDGFVLSGLASQPFYARAATNMQQAQVQAQQAESRASMAETHAQQALMIAKEALAFTSQFERQQQDQSQQVLKIMEEAQAHAARVAQQHQDQIQQALKLAEEARIKADNIDQLHHHRTQNALNVAEEARAHVAQLDQRHQDQTQLALTIAEEALAHAIDAKAHGTQAQSALDAALHSRSWRITAPLRWLGQQARRLRDEGFVSRLKALAKKIAQPLVRRSIGFIEARPGLRRKCVALAHKFGLYHALRSLYFRLLRPAPATHASVSEEAAPGETRLPLNEAPSQLSDRAKDIYSGLKAAVAARKHEGGQ